jgi:hypothetical protein
MLKQEPAPSIGSLTMTGGLAQLFSEAIFQLILLAVVIAFLVAYQLKKRRILMLLLFLGLTLVLCDLLLYLIPL